MAHRSGVGPAESAPGGGGLVGRPWARSGPEVVQVLGSDAEHGLDAHEAHRRADRYGANVLVEAARPGRRQVLARQLTNTMTVVLAVAGAITVIIGDIADAVVIAAILALDTAVGFSQEWRAERTMAALERLAAGSATVVRDGRIATLPAPALVPGDIVEVDTGDIVAADLRLVEAYGLRIDEASLTGESEPVAKSATMIEDPSAPVAERRNMAFKGTAVSGGRGRGVVVAVGMATELGRTAALLGSGPQATLLQRRLAALGRRTAAAAVATCAVVFVAGIARGEPLDDMFLTAVSLAVAAVPEGLPVTVTVALAIGARRMAERHALIRRLPAVETLGSVTVICTDKTGTLTQNRMLVERVWTPLGGLREVTGTGYSPEGEVRGMSAPEVRPELVRLACVAAACNDAVLQAPDDPGGTWSASGDPTEAALLAMAAKVGIDRGSLERDWPREAEVAFDAERRRMATVHRGSGQWWIAVKGAPAALTPLLADPTGPASSNAAIVADQLAAAGYRVLALAERRAVDRPASLEEAETGLELTGLVGIADPPRAGVADAVASCRAAGITTVMITGDHPRTAGAIAVRLGLVEADGGSETLTGADIDALTDPELTERVAQVRVVARATPAHKLRLVDAWRARGAIVAMTGDGVNDAPALRRADIGVAMGVIGTDVSKEASDMVLADDDFTTIVRAVEEGRRIHDSIRRFVRYLLTTNIGEVGVMFIAPLIGLPLPLLPLQILWINLVTDGPPAIALGLEPGEPDAMRRPPRPPGESILGDGLWQHALVVGASMTGVVLGLEAIGRAAQWPWQTMTFTTLALLQLGHALAVRSERRTWRPLGGGPNPWLGRAVVLSAAGQLATVYVPALQGPFGTEALSAVELLVVLACSATVAVAVAMGRRRRGQDSGP